MYFILRASMDSMSLPGLPDLPLAPRLHIMCGLPQSLVYPKPRWLSAADANQALLERDAFKAPWFTLDARIARDCALHLGSVESGQLMVADLEAACRFLGCEPEVLAAALNDGLEQALVALKQEAR